MDDLFNNLLSLKDYRVIVDLDMLGKYLAHCSGCENALDLQNALGFKSIHISGLLLIACHNDNCMKINKIPLTQLRENNKDNYIINEEFGNGKFKVG